ncbi:GerMN domain-containing protein [Amnibacterium flavum]|uniref:GerMN domain-containing protein n=1 Tax=Amnibacterium flavum TaxID=2173173 RepID=A0A2V1HZ59_9MICO|nr:GerMN domain-containing protein [Amnibacterium flavum]PVZ95934.1 hypothetical protein DDQ50_05590 [Amnibacterium flavum]
MTALDFARAASRWRRLAAGLVAAATLALVGCAAIPVSGPVQAGVPVTSNDDEPFAFRPAGPSDGASTADIVRGFIAAAVRPQDNYGTAREFLTDGLSKTWNPNAGVLLHESPNVVVDEGSGAVQLTISAVGQVGTSGSYAEYGESVEATLAFRLEQVDGQWRIAEAPDGIVLLRQTFERLYTQRSLYFFDPAFDNLVPDVRWFPNGADTQTRIVEALIAGPSPALASPVLATAFPPGVSLERQSVVQSDGVLIVDLDPAIVSLERISQQRLKLQLTRSLLGGSVVSVQIRADGSVLDIRDLTDVPVLQQVDPRAAVGIGDAFGWLSSNEVLPIDGLSDAVAALQPNAVALDADGGRAAVRGASGVTLVTDGGGTVPIDARGGLIAPALDSRGFVWTVPAGEPGAVQVADVNGTASAVPSGWNDLESVVSIGVSRDSTRLMVYGTADGAGLLRVYGIVRDADGRPTGLSTSWFELVPPAGTPVAATWVDETSVASVATAASGEPSIVSQVVGGMSEQLSRATSAVTISGANGESGLRLLAADGDVLVLRGAGWQVTGAGVSYLANQR